MTFRSVSFWQSALMTLPDAAFFDLLRSVLGTVKTPFNKQNLVEELSRFIVRPEIQENIAAYIDDNDRRIIAAIALLSEPGPGELESFFTGEYTYVELQGMLINLEERLIIYRFRDNDVLRNTIPNPKEIPLRIALNPRLENILAPIAANKGILFPSIDGGDNGLLGNDIAGNNIFNGRILAALFAFLLHNNVQVKDDGKELSFGFRKKVVEQSKELFLDLDIDSFAGGLLTLGLLYPEGEELIPDEAKIAAFKTLSDRNRFEYLAGAIALFLQRGSASFKNNGLLKYSVRLIHNFGSIAKDRKILPEATMIKLAELFRHQEETNWGFPASLPSAKILLCSLVKSGLFYIRIINETPCYCPVNISDTENTGDGSAPKVAVDSGFSCILYPEIGFADAMDLAIFSAVEETGTTVRFTFSRDSVIQGLNRGYSTQFLWQLLERLSGSRTPDILKWNLDDWEKRWKEVSLNQGVILTLSGERSYLAQTQPLVSMIKQNLAPGVFLLSAGMEEVAAALRSAGVDIVGRPKRESIIESSSDVTFSFFSPLPKIPDKSTEVRVPSPEGESGNNAEQLKERFRLSLENMQLAKQEREELESRIERRMVVSETQLKDTSLRHEKLEARSLDYVGKTGIVKQAIVSGSLLELSCLNGEKILGFPESLDKKGGEMILSIRPREGGETEKLALGKISLIRRIKQSIFGA